MKPCFIGIDAGTSGIRASVIDTSATEICTRSVLLTPAEITGNRCEAEPLEWRDKCDQLLTTLAAQLKNTHKICAISIDGTSGTLLACDTTGQPLGNALMYNDQQSVQAAEKIATAAPAGSNTFDAALGAGASLAKALTLLQRYPETRHLCHQADWLAGNLTGNYRYSDENNCLKSGYDIINRCWPEWIFSLGIQRSQLPEVVAPGDFFADIKPDIARHLGLPEDCRIIAGTTDSIAAVIATGVQETGDAVTSLGSTLVLKLLADKPVFAREYGIYSHRLGRHWLVGGASNTGGRVLEQYFNRKQLDSMTTALQPDKPTGLDYYPLPGTGERFPVNDSQKEPVLTPRPESDIVFFQAILEAISRIEKQGYEKLQALGAGRLERLITCGGGDRNPAWRKIRELTLAMPITSARYTEASYGSALLAKLGWQNKREKPAD